MDEQPIRLDIIERVQYAHAEASLSIHCVSTIRWFAGYYAVQPNREHQATNAMISPSVYVIVRPLSTVEYTSVASLFYCRQWSD